MRRLHLVGRSGMGKTTLIQAVLPLLTAEGLRVGTLKHSGHAHPLDKPGSDSQRHREAGAMPAAIATPEALAIQLPRQSAHDLYQQLQMFYATCDLWLVEGDHTQSSAERWEVWRAGQGQAPYANEIPGISRMIGDPCGLNLARLPLSPSAVCAAIIAWLRAD